MKLLSTKEVAAILMVNRHQVGIWQRSGELESVTLPGTRRPKFTPEAIQQFIERSSSGPFDGPTAPSKTIKTEPRLAQLKRAGRPVLIEKEAWRKEFRA